MTDSFIAHTQIDRLIEKMVQNNVTRADLADDKPMRLMGVQGQQAGSVTTAAQLRGILQEVQSLLQNYRSELVRRSQLLDQGGSA